MTRARRELVDLDTTPYYHCINRCVRRAYLCGQDPVSRRSYDHRKQWIVERIKTLAAVFAIDLCAYAVMSDHYHLVVRLDRHRAQAWSPEEVIVRWYALFRGHLFVDRYRAGESLTAAERKRLWALVETWRARLCDLGWFMRCLNEPIARQANDEDGCTGRFWQGRYTSQALLDEAALLTCMSYVDLNPVRAGLATTPEASVFTSIQERMRAVVDAGDPVQADAAPTPAGLLALRGEAPAGGADGIPFRLSDYLTLVDWTGRALREDKPGAIPAHLAPWLTRLGIAPERWPVRIAHYGRPRRAVGAVQCMKAFAARLGQRWLWGQSAHSPCSCPQRL